MKLINRRTDRNDNFIGNIVIWYFATIRKTSERFQKIWTRRDQPHPNARTSQQKLKIIPPMHGKYGSLILPER